VLTKTRAFVERHLLRLAAGRVDRGGVGAQRDPRGSGNATINLGRGANVVAIIDGQTGGITLPENFAAGTDLIPSNRSDGTRPRHGSPRRGPTQNIFPPRRTISL
jgi:hypothetical protein